MKTTPKCTASSQALDLTRTLTFTASWRIWLIVFGPLSRKALRGTQLCSLNSTVSLEQNRISGKCSRQFCKKKAAGNHFMIIPAAGNESLLAIPYLTSRSAYGQSTDPLRTGGTKVTSWGTDRITPSVFTQDIKDETIQQAALSCHLYLLDDRIKDLVHQDVWVTDKQHSPNPHAF